MPPSQPTFRSDVRAKLLTIVLVPLLLLGAAGWVLLGFAQAQTRIQFRQSAARGMAAIISERLDTADHALQQARSALEQSKSPALADSKLRIALDASPNLEAVVLLDPAGIVTAAETRDDVRGRKADLQGMDLSRLAAVATQRFTVGAPGSLSPVSGKPLLILRQPLRDKRQVMAFIDGNSLVSAITPSPDPDDAFLLVSSERHVVSQSPGIDGTAVASLLGGPATSDVLGFTPTQIAPADWTLWYKGEPASLQSFYPRLRFYTLVGTVAIAAITAYVALWLARQLSRPIEGLLEQSRQAVNSGVLTNIAPQPFAETEAVAAYLRHMLDTCSQQQLRQSGLRQALALTAFPQSQNSPETALTDLTSMLATVTQAHCVLIAQWQNEGKPRARVLASRSSVPLPSAYSYDLTGHPAANLTTGKTVFVNSRVSQHYPESPLLRLLGAEGYIAVPLLSSDGGVIGHIEIIDDHELKISDDLRDVLLAMACRAAGILQQQRALRQTSDIEDLYRTVSQDQLELACRWTADTTLTFVNDAFCRFTGRSRHELLGSSLLPFIHEEDRDPLRTRSLELSGDRPVEQLDLRLIDHEQRITLHRWITRALHDAKGRLIEFQGTALNVTHLRDVESELAELRSRFAALSENTPVAFWITDWTTQRCIFANGTFLATWGISQQFLDETPLAWSVGIREDDRASVVRHYLLQAAEGPYAETYHLVRPDGTTLLIRDRAIPLRHPDGHVHRIAHIATEITG